MSRPISLLLVIAGLLLIPGSAAYAEVMDKEPSPAHIWASSLLASGLSFVFTRFRWWLVLACLPVAVFVPLSAILEFHDPFVGPAIFAEAGRAYQLHAYFALGAVVVSNLAGVICGLRQRGRNTAHTEAP